MNKPQLDKVVFRKFKEGDIIALFPCMKESNYRVNSYMHIGQHSAADYDGVISITTPATQEEYADLKAELTSIGYNLKVLKRQPPYYYRQ
ncbi:MAG: hypothetical protein WC365_07645 [Candidatus Babeliales bacterium]|jgi:hypothetical protein